MRNPDWVRDEVILAMDLYFQAGRKQVSATHPAVVTLSETLNRLPIHDLASRTATFRNPAGISMILGNFLGVDPDHPAPGLSRSNQLQMEVWTDFADAPDTLRRTAEAIGRVANDAQGTSGFLEWELQEVFVEGEVLTRLHLIRERSTEAVRRKKERVLSETGRLACEACGIDFSEVYGPLGQGFAECHHMQPLADIPGERATRLADLAIVCANCHRMLHRGRPRHSIAALHYLVTSGRREK